MLQATAQVIRASDFLRAFGLRDFGFEPELAALSVPRGRCPRRLTPRTTLRRLAL
jgi:hypothetical protein